MTFSPFFNYSLDSSLFCVLLCLLEIDSQIAIKLKHRAFLNHPVVKLNVFSSCVIYTF